MTLHWSGIGRAERARVQFFDGEGEELVTYDEDLRAYQLSPEQEATLAQLRVESAAVAAALSESDSSKE